MIKQVSMKDFKVFEDETLSLSTLNILTGFNNSGKSSVIQAMRLLHEGSPLSGLGPLSGMGLIGSYHVCGVQRDRLNAVFETEIPPRYPDGVLRAVSFYI